MLTYTLVTNTVPPGAPWVRVKLMVIPPDGFSSWAETDRDRYMLERAADALARQVGHRPAYLDFDYFELRESSPVASSDGAS